MVTDNQMNPNPETIAVEMTEIEANTPTVPETPKLPSRNPDDWLTEHFSKKEMTRSDTAARHGVANIPNKQEWKNILFSANQMEKIRAYACSKTGRDVGVIVTSCFRSEEVNRLVGGASKSAHRFGLAVDFDLVGFTSKQTADLVKEMSDKGLIKYDQLILEFPKNGAGAWVHIGFKQNERDYRHQELTANKVRGRTVYSEGLIA